jgi:hypothetical protein
MVHYTEKPPPPIEIVYPDQLLLLSRSVLDACIAEARDDLRSYLRGTLDELTTASGKEGGLSRRADAAIDRRTLDAHTYYGFHSMLPKRSRLYSLLRGLSDSVKADSHTIALCPETICGLAQDFHATRMTDIPALAVEEIAAATVLRHELGHVLLDPRIKSADLRLNEGFANRFAYDTSDQLERRFLNEFAAQLELQYNYFILLPFLEDLTTIAEAILQQDFDGASHRFYIDLERQISHTLGEAYRSTLVARKGVGGFAGFGSVGCKILVAERLQFLANAKRAIVCAGRIDAIFGALDPFTVVFCNELGTAEHYYRLPPNVRLVPRQLIDLELVLSSKQTDSASVLELLRQEYPELIGMEVVRVDG